VITGRDEQMDQSKNRTFLMFLKKYSIRNKMHILAMGQCGISEAVISQVSNWSTPNGEYPTPPPPECVSILNTL